MKKKLLIMSLMFVLIIGTANSAFAIGGEKVKFSGYLGFRYDYGDDSNGAARDRGVLKNAINADITASYLIDDRTAVHFHTNNYQEMRYTGNYTTDTVDTYVTTSLGDYNLRVGNFGADSVGYGLVKGGGGYNTNVRGVELAHNFNDKLKATVFSGSLEGKGNDEYPNQYYYDIYGDEHGGKYDFVELAYKLSDKTNIKGVYHQNRDYDNQYYEVGFDTKLPHHFSATVAGATASLDTATINTDDTSYMARLKYGEAAFWAPGHSWDLFATYHKNPANATLDGGLDNDFYGAHIDNFKGVVLGGHYVIRRGILLTGFVMNGERISTDKWHTREAGDDFTAARMQVDFIIF
ncbi:hypothetical protein BX659_11757 [Orenia metallireducens]|uniref:Porin n=1 Tax=Orenia metallireducens TaxID=1413210 RepID=A0A285HHR3_9FIRM|nr:hypothetical protein [Orenia metallireducens]PRX27192.1 hypothetical protein BX659_11757 [Orenia metallireducens]SNY35255.1 hypothetical protein SAMN06265827_11957 [Orenia metallireducens]